jgi:hypothetical protein
LILIVILSEAKNPAALRETLPMAKLAAIDTDPSAARRPQDNNQNLGE